MDYSELTAADQKQMVKARVHQLEAEHYQHTLNAEVIAATPAPADEAEAAALDRQREATTAALAALEVAHAIAVTERDKLGPVRDDEPADDAEAVR